jgi:hypothetical protein
VPCQYTDGAWTTGSGDPAEVINPCDAPVGIDEESVLAPLPPPAAPFSTYRDGSPFSPLCARRDPAGGQQ